MLQQCKKQYARTFVSYKRAECANEIEFWENAVKEARDYYFNPIIEEGIWFD